MLGKPPCKKSQQFVIWRYVRMNIEKFMNCFYVVFFLEMSN